MELDPQYAQMDATGCIHAIRKAGGDVRVGGACGIRLIRQARLPSDLVLRALELRETIHRVLEVCPTLFCPSCTGTAFYRRMGRWHCLGCEGLPEGRPPETWARTAPEP